MVVIERRTQVLGVCGVDQGAWYKQTAKSPPMRRLAGYLDVKVLADLVDCPI